MLNHKSPTLYWIVVGTLVIAFSQSVYAEIHKWQDSNDKTHYGDAPMLAGTKKIVTDVPTESQLENGNRMRLTNDANGIREGAAVSGKCLFEYTGLSQSMHMMLDPLAHAATEECINNAVLIKHGRGTEVHYDALNAWQAGMQMKENRRNNIQMQLRLDGIQSRQRGFGY